MKLILNNERGATMLEHALALPLFLGLLLVTFNTLWLCYTQLAIQYVANSVVREVAIHGVDVTQPDTTEEAIRSQLQGFAASFKDDRDRVFICGAANFPTCGGGDPVAIAPAGGRQLVVVRITKPMDLLGGMLGPMEGSGLSWQRITLSATAVGRQES